MITILSEKMIDVIEASKTLIESSGFNPDNRYLPQNISIQNGNFFIDNIFKYIKDI